MKILKSVSLLLLTTFVLSLVGFNIFLRSRYVVPILTYHHINPSSNDMLTVSSKSFDEQMDFIEKNGFHVIGFNELAEGIRNKRQFPHNTVVISFDDGNKDNYNFALPILKKHKFPAIEFISSDLIDSPGYLNWNNVVEMEQNGFIISSHTRNHAYLPDLTLNALREEIVGSKKLIETKLKHKIHFIAYPNGGFTNVAKAIIEEAGYKAAVTTNRGQDRYNRNLYELKRIRMNDLDNRYYGLILFAKMSGFYNLMRSSKSVVLQRNYSAREASSV